MEDIIQFMPDQLANQIAAGEVVQRPASAVKELLENAIDAGASDIQLIIKDAGKELIQVVDNGCGMSPIDARMSFERHATSKIKNIDDLFAIHTMGFRGEALASIGAVAQVTLKSRRDSDDVGTQIDLEAGEVKNQEAVACSKGANFAIRNLFYNVPARRKFLKSKTTEYRHILEEFTRVAMAFPEITFRLFNDDIEQYNLKAGSLKSRIIALLGVRVEKNLIPVSEKSELLSIEGFIGKPASASKKRGHQFFFVNNRFIRSAYLNHAVKTAFEGLIDGESFPLYVLRLSLNAESVDVNVHPSKQEVKFDDEQILYAYLHSAIKRVLGQFNVRPSLDFTINTEIQNLEAIRLPFSDRTKQDTEQGFLAQTFSQSGQAHLINTKKERQDWERQRQKFFPDAMPTNPSDVPSVFSPAETEAARLPETPLEWGEYLMATVKSGVLLVHKRRARERIIYETLESKIRNEKPSAQQLLFPLTLDLSMSDTLSLRTAMPFLKTMGFVFMESVPDKGLEITGLPAGLPESSVQDLLSVVIEQVEINAAALANPSKKIILQKMAQCMARNSDDNSRANMTLIDELFACKTPQTTPGGKSIFTILTGEKLQLLIDQA